MGPPQVAGPDVTDQISHSVWDVAHRGGDLTVHPRTNQAPEITSPPSLIQWHVNDKGWDTDAGKFEKVDISSIVWSMPAAGIA